MGNTQKLCQVRENSKETVGDYFIVNSLDLNNDKNKIEYLYCICKKQQINTFYVPSQVLYNKLINIRQNHYVVGPKVVTNALVIWKSETVILPQTPRPDIVQKKQFIYIEPAGHRTRNLSSLWSSDHTMYSGVQATPPRMSSNKHLIGIC